MPKNKDALIRFRVINKCLREREFATLQDLKSACERALDIYPIGTRTIEADISAMRHDEGLGYFAPIKINRARRMYYYDDPDYSIDNIPLNSEELESLVFAARLLDQYRDIEIFRTFTGSVRKLVDALNIYRLNDEDAVRNFIEFETVEATKGTEHLEVLIEAVKDRCVLKIEYKSFVSPKSTTPVIHPYHLKEYRNRWFLIGYNDKYKGMRTYGLDRIISITPEYGMQFTDIGFDARKYYENVVGISVLDKEPLEIFIAFSGIQAQYLSTQPLHHSQRQISSEPDKIIFRFFLVPNYEFYAQILGWGDEVEVLSPPEVRQYLVEMIKDLAQRYE